MKPLVLFAALLCLTASLRALEFRVLSWEGDISGLKFQAGDKVVEISAPDGSLSRPYKLAPDAPLHIYRESLINGEPVRIPVTIPTPPSGLERGILVLVTGPDAHTFIGSWLEDSVEQAPPGTVRFYNYTKLPLALKTPGEQWLQSPGQTHRVAFDTSRRSIPIQVAAQDGDKWSRVANVAQPVRPTHRLLVFLRDARPSLGGPKELIELRVFYDL